MLGWNGTGWDEMGTGRDRTGMREEGRGEREGGGEGKKRSGSYVGEEIGLKMGVNV